VEGREEHFPRRHMRGGGREPHLLMELLIYGGKREHE
jgi:hypothetical protein